MHGSIEGQELKPPSAARKGAGSRGGRSMSCTEFVAELAVVARSLISASSPGWCATNLLVVIHSDDECVTGCAIGFDPTSVAVCGEVLRIDDH